MLCVVLLKSFSIFFFFYLVSLHFALLGYFKQYKDEKNLFSWFRLDVEL